MLRRRRWSDFGNVSNVLETNRTNFVIMNKNTHTPKTSTEHKKERESVPCKMLLIFYGEIKRETECVCVCEDVINIMNIRRSNINTCRNVIIMKEKWFCITGVRSLCRTSQWIKEPQWESEKCCCKCLIHTHTQFCLASFRHWVNMHARVTGLSPRLRLCLCVSGLFIGSVMIFRFHFGASFCSFPCHAGVVFVFFCGRYSCVVSA